MKNKVVARMLACLMASAILTTTVAGNGMWQPVTVMAEEQSAITKNLTIENVKFDPTKDWDAFATNGSEEHHLNLSTNTECKKGMNISYDVLIPADKSHFTGIIKAQTVFRIGSGMEWTEIGTNDLSFDEDVTVDGVTYKKATINLTMKDDPKVKGNLANVTLKIAGYQCTYEGDIIIANARLEQTEVSDTKETLAYDSGDKSVESTFDFSKILADDKEDWSTTIKQLDVDSKVSGVTVSDNAIFRGKVTIDKDAYESLAADGSYIKLQTVMKLGDKSEWNEGKKFPYLDKNSFKENEDGTTYSADFEDKFDALKGGNDLREVIVRAVGKIAKGSMTVSDVKIYNVVSTDAPLPEKEATVVEDFESATDGENAGWANEDGWQYNKTITPVVASANGSKALKLNLDYTGCEDSTWSEAKISKTFSEGYDVSAYNLLTYDIIYPKEFDNFKTKVFAKNVASDTEVINKEGTISDKTELADGLMKATVSVKFNPNEQKLDQMTIGTVGVSTSFKGEVYIDNIKLSQEDATADYVTIEKTADTAKAKKEAVSITNMESSVSLADQNASAETLALYSYLKKLDTNNQVLFGHQNDTHKSVNKNGSGSDTRDITGSISGIVGIDSLALTGMELGEKDTATALTKSIEIGKNVAAEGGILTLSTHMPNMSNEKIKKNVDGTYDFSECDFSESKDLTNMKGSGAKEVLPGGKYNAQFTAYLDIIAKYAKGLGDIPVLFRPFHEGDGNWFWWGAADDETYKAIFRYTEDYLQEQDVHNFIYVYSPCGPTSEATYMNRYPGDAYVDVLSFDYYDDYSGSGADYNDSYFTNLKESCKQIKKYADEKGKVAAIAEAGVRVTKDDGSDSEGLLVKNNPIKGQNWYSNMNKVAKETGMSYFLLWANFGETNFYIPYKYNDTKGQELINEFIDFYNEESSIFADGTNFYDAASKTKVENANKGTTPSGYMTGISSKDAITVPTTLTANVKNASSVKFVLKNGDVTQELEAVKDKTGNTYRAAVTAEVLRALGTTDQGSIELVADSTSLAKLTYISFNKEKDVLAANVIENFDLYFGDNAYLASSFSSNGSGGSSATITLDTEHAKSGTNAGAFTYTLVGDGAYAGKIKSGDYDFSKYNALQMWVEPDGKGQKLIIQIGDASGEEYEVNLSEFAKGTTGKYVTIPFASFKPKNGGTLNPARITKFAIYCNRIDKNVTASTIYFDEIQAVNISSAEAAGADEAGLILTDEAIGSTTPRGSSSSGSSSVSGGSTAKDTTVTNPDGSKTETTVTTKPDGSKVETVTTTNKDGSQKTVTNETEKNAAGKTVTVTTTTNKDAAGNVTGTIQKKEIADAGKNTSATVTTVTDSKGNTSVKADVVKTGTKVAAGTKGTISADVVDQITEAAGTKDVVITQKVVGKDGKTAYTVSVNAKDLTSGKKLTLVKYNKKTGKYVLCNKKTYTVKDNGVSVTAQKSASYQLLNEKDAAKLVKNVVATVKPAKKSKDVEQGKTTSFSLSKALDMANVAKITYASTDKSIAKVDKNGKITSNKAGKATIKATVTLVNGQKKTVKMTLTVSGK